MNNGTNNFQVTTSLPLQITGGTSYITPLSQTNFTLGTSYTVTINNVLSSTSWLIITSPQITLSITS